MSNDHLSLVGRTSEAAIKNLIYRLPGRPPFMLAQDVAKVYETETRAVNQAVQRNPERFPDSFCFRLTREEADHLRSQNVIINNPAYLPNAFSHAGANMLSAVLTSPVAVARSIQINDAFTNMEKMTQGQEGVLPSEALLQVVQNMVNLEREQHAQATRLNDQAERLAIVEAKTDQNSGNTGYFTVRAWCRMNGISIPLHAAQAVGRKAAKVSKENGVGVGRAPDEMFGFVNTYHKDVLAEVLEGHNHDVA